MADETTDDGAKTVAAALKGVKTRRTTTDFEELLDAEKVLLRAAVEGRFAQVGAAAGTRVDVNRAKALVSVRPKAPIREGTGANVGRANFLRHLILGGCPAAPPHPKGVRLVGGWIDGALDLSGCMGPSTICLWGCHFTDPLNLHSATLKTFGLDASRIAAETDAIALEATRARFEGGLNLRYGFHVTGNVRLSGANIAGHLDCDGGRFEAEANGYALQAAGATIGGSALFRKGFHATGTVGLHSANITGGFDCDGGRFEAAERSHALIGQDLTVGGLFRMTLPPADGEMFTGELFLNGATVGALSDSVDCWPKRGKLHIRDFTCDRIFDAPDTAAARARWLRLQPASALGSDFQPQPWDQVETVLRAKGRPLEARRIGEMREWARFRAGRARPNGRSRLSWALARLARAPFRLVEWLYGVLTGFGYFTTRTLIPFVLFWLLGAVLFEAAWREGAMAPPQAFVLANDAWQGCEASHPDNPAACWTAEQAAGERYYRFEPLLYSFDVFLPVLSLEQEESWEPSAGFGAPVGSAAAIDDVVDDWFGNWAAGSLGPAIRSVFSGASWLVGAGEASIGDVARVYRRAHEMMGYLLSGFLLAGAARLVRQE